MQIHNEVYMKIFFLLIAVTITNFLYPCNWMLDLVDKKQTEALRILHNFDDPKYYKTENDINELADYWYNVGRAEALLDIQRDLHKQSINKYNKTIGY